MVGSFKALIYIKKYKKVLALSRSHEVRGERGIEQEDEHLNDFFTAPHRTTWGSFFVAETWVHFVDSSDSVREICAGFLIDINSSQDAGSLRVMEFWKIHLGEQREQETVGPNSKTFRTLSHGIVIILFEQFEYIFKMFIRNSTLKLSLLKKCRYRTRSSQIVDFEERSGFNVNTL